MTVFADAKADQARRIPCASLLLSLAALILCLAPATVAEQLQFHRAWPGQVWRIFTSHWTHWSFDHALWDILVFLGLGAVCERRDRRSFLRCVFFSAALIPALVWLLLPQITSYRGLSGIDSALFGLLATRMALTGWQQRERQRIAVAAVALGGFLAKTTYETASGATLFVDSAGGGFIPMPLAHLVGALIGVVCAIRSAASRRQRTCLA